MDDTSRQAGPLPESLRHQLDAAHRSLLGIHKALLDHERARYERAHGRVESAGAYLQLVINDPYFAWLGPLTQVIVAIDEFASSRKPRVAAEGEALLART